MAIGSRALADSMVDGTYAVRSVMGRLFNRLVTTGTGLGLQDTQCGFKAFRTPVARLLFHLVRIDRFAFDVEVLARARRLGLRITEVPVQWRHVPGSTIHPLHDSVTMLTDVYRSAFGLLATPPVPGIVVLDAPAPATVDAAGEPEGGAARGGSGRQVVADSLDGAPVRWWRRAPSVIVLLPLVDPAEVATVFSALRAEFPALHVSRRSLTLEALAGLGPLAGRLRAASDPSGMG